MRLQDGEDLMPMRTPTADAIARGDTENPERPGSKRRRKFGEEDETPGRRRAKLSDQQRWEIQQLANAGVLVHEERPDWNDDTGVMPVNVDPEEELDIELNEHEPAFL